MRNWSMKTILTVARDNGLEAFLHQYGSEVMGHLSGYDRLRLRGTLRSLYHAPVMERYLSKCHVRLLAFKDYVRQVSQRICTTAKALATQLGRPYRYLPSSLSDLAPTEFSRNFEHRRARQSPVDNYGPALREHRP